MSTRRDAAGQATLDQRLAFFQVFAAHGTAYVPAAGGVDATETGPPPEDVRPAAEVPAQRTTSIVRKAPSEAGAAASPQAKRAFEQPASGRVRKKLDTPASAVSPKAKRRKTTSASPRGYAARVMSL
jgi:hypothetical protein